MKHPRCHLHIVLYMNTLNKKMAPPYEPKKEFKYICPRHLTARSYRWTETTVVINHRAKDIYGLVRHQTLNKEKFSLRAKPTDGRTWPIAIKDYLFSKRADIIYKRTILTRPVLVRNFRKFKTSADSDAQNIAQILPEHKSCELGHFT